MINITEIKEKLPEEALMDAGDLPFKKVSSGKVREMYDAGEYLLMVTTDRISAFDVVLPNGIPGKGVVLTQISRYWFERCKDMIPNHLAPDHDQKLLEVLKDRKDLILRTMLVRKLKPLPVEAVVRGYISGSAWTDYKKTGKIFGQEAPEGLQESDKLPEPIFTPTTKPQEGHDTPISLDECRNTLGAEVYEKVRKVSMELFDLGSRDAATAGMILADTKFEFGTDDHGNLYLIDEVLTPDSSRYWPADLYQPGKPQPSYDKQFVRDYLNTLDWNKEAPGPELPPNVIEGTRMRYRLALEALIA